MLKLVLVAPALALGLSACMSGQSSAPPSSTVIASASSSATCEELATEIAGANATIEEVNAQEAGAFAAGVGSAVAGQAMAMAGAGFLGAIVSRSGDIANLTAAQREQAKRDAEVRLSTLEGLYVGRGCTP